MSANPHAHVPPHVSRSFLFSNLCAKYIAPLFNSIVSLHIYIASFFQRTCCILPSVFSSISNLINDPSLIAPLQFLEFHHNQSTFVGMLDSGSQLNLIDESILPLMNAVPISAPHWAFRGVQGHLTKIERWVSFNIVLANGSKLQVKAAVVDSIPCSIILGQPFLITNSIILDSQSAMLHTKKGPIKLLSQQRRETTSASAQACHPNGVPDLDEELQLQSSMLTEPQKQKLRRLMNNYRRLWEGKQPGKAKHVKHRIRVDTEDPIRDIPRYHTSDQNKEIMTQVQDMLQHGILQPSNSPHAAEIVMAKKKDSDGKFTGWRLCLDYRLLNRHTVKDAYPIPRITDLLRSIQGSRYFVALDLRWGY